jgi:hypothetical protein
LGVVTEDFDIVTRQRFPVWPLFPVIEFKKVRRNETVESAVESALKQIDEQKYETELVQRGIKNFKKLAVIFKGKDVTIREG